MRSGWRESRLSTMQSWLKGCAILLPLLALLMTSCSQQGSQTKTIVLEKGEIQKLPDGSYKVNRAWLYRRVQAEAALHAALKRCKEGVE